MQQLIVQAFVTFHVGTAVMKSSYQILTLKKRSIDEEYSMDTSSEILINC